MIPWRPLAFGFVYVVQIFGSVLFVYWLWTEGWNYEVHGITSGFFFGAEVIAFISSTLFLFCGIFSPGCFGQTPADQNALHEAMDEEKGQPVVAICVCRYKEPLVDLLLTMHTMLEVAWPESKLQLYILDDGWYNQDDDFHREQAGQLAALVEDSEPLPPSGLPIFESTQNVLRPDCATESTYWNIRKAKPGRCAVTLIARRKPTESHFKAGNVNNFLYNHLGHIAEQSGALPRYLLLLDHDMLPAKTILWHSVPRMEREHDLAFLQFPQRFYDIGGKDVLYAGNEIFFDGVQLNRGEIGLTAFAGTNAVWSLSCLFTIGGLQYGSCTEDANTGMVAHTEGYLSRYSRLQLAVGQSPQTVPDAMQQRMRWSKGALEMLITQVRRSMPPRFLCPDVIASHYSDILPPAPPPWWRRAIIGIIYVDSMIYPLYSIGFPLHFVVCVLYLITNEAPVAPENPMQLLTFWIPLYTIKAICQTLAFRDVKIACQWNSQMAWGGYSLSTLVSIGQALGLNFSAGVSEWFNTGAGSGDRFLLQYGNTAMGLILYLLLLYRAFAFVFFDKACRAWESIGACMYGFVLLLHLKDWALEPIKAALQQRSKAKETRMDADNDPLVDSLAACSLVKYASGVSESSSVVSLEAQGIVSTAEGNSTSSGPYTLPPLIGRTRSALYTAESRTSVTVVNTFEGRLNALRGPLRRRTSYAQIPLHPISGREEDPLINYPRGSHGSSLGEVGSASDSEETTCDFDGSPFGSTLPYVSGPSDVSESGEESPFDAAIQVQVAGSRFNSVSAREQRSKLQVEEVLTPSARHHMKHRSRMQVAEARRRVKVVRFAKDKLQDGLSKPGPESHRHALILSRESAVKHSIDLSIPVLLSLVVLMTCILGFWATNNCDVELGRGRNEVLLDARPGPPAPCSINRANLDPVLPRGVYPLADFEVGGGGLRLNGHSFTIKGTNWFGFETTRNMAYGLDVVAQDAVLSSLVEQGFNSLRLPVAVKSVLNPTDFIALRTTINEDLNPHMPINNYLDAVAAFVERAAQWGVFTLLDMHLLRNDKQADPLPFDDVVRLTDVKLAWQALAERLCNHWAVMGADLKNEPFGATWGDGTESDWRAMAEWLGTAVYRACPRWLVFVQGVHKFDSASNPLTSMSSRGNAWGSMLQPVATDPVRLPDMSKLVYSPHLYGPGTIGSSYMWESNYDGCLVCQYCRDRPTTLNCNDCTADTPGLLDAVTPACRALLPVSGNEYPRNMRALWDWKFGYLRDLNVSVVVGEWGGTYANEPITNRPMFPAMDASAQERLRGLEAVWNDEFVAYLADNRVGSFYWSVNPESDDTQGLLLADWTSFDTAKLALLARLPSTDVLPLLFPSTRRDLLRQCLDTRAGGIEALYRFDGGSRYQAEANVYNMDYDGAAEPAAIVFPVSEVQVAEALRCAAEAEKRVCVRGGGNSYTGDSTCDGLLVDVQHLTGLESVDGEEFWVGAGYRMGPLVTALQERKRLINTPYHGGIGVGWFLGCGHGMLSRELGLACDQMIAARVVLGNGTLVEARDGNGHAELLWALRGAGSYFGVVVAVLLRTESGLPPVHSCNSNTIVNAGFEDIMSLTPAGWDVRGASMEVVEDRDEAPEGSRFLHMFGRTASWNAPFLKLNTSCLDAGVEYEFTAMLKLPGGVQCMRAYSGVRCAEVLLRVDGVSALLGFSWGGADGEWNQITTTFTLSEEQVQAEDVWLGIQVPEIVDCWLDDLNVEIASQKRISDLAPALGDLADTLAFATFRLSWPRWMAAQVIALWQDWALEHPNNRFSCEVWLWNSAVTSISLEGTLRGDLAELDDLLQHALSVLGAALEDTRKQHTYAELTAQLWGVNDVYLLRDPYAGFRGERRAFYNKGHAVKNRLNQEGIAALVMMADQPVPGAGASDNYIQLIPLGGRVTTPSRPSATPRDAVALVQYGGYWRSEAAKAAMVSYQLRVHSTMEQWWGTSGFYCWKDNELEGWAEAYWGENSVKRLREVKCEYDVEERFSTSEQTIKPAEGCVGR